MNTVDSLYNTGRNTLSPNEVLIDMDMRYTREDWEQLMSK